MENFGRWLKKNGHQKFRQMKIEKFFSGNKLSALGPATSIKVVGVTICEHSEHLESLLIRIFEPSSLYDLRLLREYDLWPAGLGLTCEIRWGSTMAHLLLIPPSSWANECRWGWPSKEDHAGLRNREWSPVSTLYETGFKDWMFRLYSRLTWCYSASSSPLLLRSAPDTAQILCRSFTPKRHRQMWVKDLPKVHKAARAGVEPTTLRLKAIESTNAPPRPTLG